MDKERDRDMNIKELESRVSALEREARENIERVTEKMEIEEIERAYYKADSNMREYSGADYLHSKYLQFIRESYRDILEQRVMAEAERYTRLSVELLSKVDDLVCILSNSNIVTYNNLSNLSKVSNSIYTARSILLELLD